MILTYFDGAMRRKDERRAQKAGSHSLARARCFVAALLAEHVSEFTQKLSQESHTSSSGVTPRSLQAQEYFYERVFGVWKRAQSLWKATVSVQHRALRWSISDPWGAQESGINKDMVDLS